MYKTKQEIENILYYYCNFRKNPEFFINDDLSVCIYGYLKYGMELNLKELGINVKHYAPDTKEYKIFKTIKALKK